MQATNLLNVYFPCIRAGEYNLAGNRGGVSGKYHDSKLQSTLEEDVLKYQSSPIHLALSVLLVFILGEVWSPRVFIIMQLPLSLVYLALQLLIAAKPAWSIQLWYSSKDLPDSFPQACRVALSQNITCSELIPGSKAASQAIYSKQDLARLCTTSCSNSLQGFQKNVRDGCGDQILTFNGTSTTGPELADPLVWAHGVTCLQNA